MLLARYQPVVVVHPTERFAPTAVGAFVRSATLERRTPGGWVPVERASSPLPTADPTGCTSSDSSPCWRLRDPRCSVSVGVVAAACYAGLDAAEAPAPAVYGAFHRRGARIALQYWLWYRANVWSGRFPPDDFVWQSHEGDWEVVTVILTAAGKPLLVGYSQHGCGKRRAWKRVPRVGGTHPLVYSALGSHANYFAAGRLPFDLSPDCYPRIAASLLQGFLGKVWERTGRGARYGPALRGVKRARLVRVTSTSPQWMRFPGSWGEMNLFHVPPPIGTNPGGPAPDGPAFHSDWRDPVGSVLRWRAG
jgi:hypothetical protein